MQNNSSGNHLPSLWEVKNITKKLPFMTLEQAEWISGVIQKERIIHILEIGFFHGVSTCYLASAVAPVSGHVTSIDIPYSADLVPPAEELIDLCGLDSFVTIVREPAGAAWQMMKMIEQNTIFDLCYIDDAHVWSITGMHFFLAEKLLRPGGFLLLDDLKWTIAGSRSGNVKGVGLSDEQRRTPQVGKVWDLLVKSHANMFNFQETGGFGLCQKKFS